MIQITEDDFENICSKKMDTGLGVRIGDVVTLDDNDKVVNVIGNIYDNPELEYEYQE